MADPTTWIIPEWIRGAPWLNTQEELDHYKGRLLDQWRQKALAQQTQSRTLSYKEVVEKAKPSTSTLETPSGK
jgi:hypothetical protein